ncbi:four-carbon acid sugar kinase family protein [Azohydromonas lata]|uniref:Four-carbon acid sugar kinase family protein n=1 Tax=Azohydromonas lata TaxID=45677 RepID=A0ABU5IED9_9BURK|nr:four-carbon acid sugar kinase family protein [Azohydromonas lata]MDZ5457486.1 four-carbon acid sugar kinase family protein [Azohydromonas lata]
MSDQRASRPLRLAFYGDDFTGSTDALEVLAFSGLRCALFLSVPTPQQMDALGGFDAIGVAGSSRAMTTAELDAHLPGVFAGLAALPTPLVHYKVCSTFDSAPATGSIGHVMELAREAFTQPLIPIVAATPALGRYCLFGHLFARSGTDGQVYRIDRHPIMSVHPVTPMHESDLARHLGQQTTMPIGHLPLTRFEAAAGALAGQLAAMAPSFQAVVLDGLEAGHLTQAGECLQQMASAQASPLFVVGGSGVEYGLTQHWQQQDGQAAPAKAADRYSQFEAVEQVLVVSGSASRLSATQIQTAVDTGFREVTIDVQALSLESQAGAAVQRLVREVLDVLATGASVVMHTARGPDDARIDALIQALQAQGYSADAARHHGGRLVSDRLGEVVDAIVRAHPLRRLVLSGGDTSSRITQVLAPDALEIKARLAPGAPLCRLLSNQPYLQGLELALKGGQMGSADYFVKALRGSGLPA